jgi:hypothetical protein
VPTPTQVSAQPNYHGQAVLDHAKARMVTRGHA